MVSQASLMECDLKANGLQTRLSLAESRRRNGCLAGQRGRATQLEIGLR